MLQQRQTRSPRFMIAGSGQSALSCARFLVKQGFSVFVSEGRGELSLQAVQVLQELNVPFESGGHSFARLANGIDILVVSPGIPLDSPLVLFANRHRIPVISEIEVAAWSLSRAGSLSCSVGITGTNGKSTTTHYLHQLLLRAGRVAQGCGNIGLPLTQAVLEASEDCCYVVELSSYQLEATVSFRPRATIFLNLQPDHMARYQTLEDYLKAKWRLLLLTADDGLAVVEKNVLLTGIRLGLSLPGCRVCAVSLAEENGSANDCFVASEARGEHDFCFTPTARFAQTLPRALYGALRAQDEETLLATLGVFRVHLVLEQNAGVRVMLGHNSHELKEWRIHEPCLKGAHNAFNLLCASLVAQDLAVQEDLICAQWEKKTSTFIPLPHRLETVHGAIGVYKDVSGREKKLTIVNDSKATNLESVLVALSAYVGPVRLLAGGEPKGNSYQPLIACLQKNLVKIYPFGKAAPIIFDELADLFPDRVANPFPTMLSAANAALCDAVDGDVLLLSPGGSSFDEFQNFEHRGDVFRHWALSFLQQAYF